MLAAGSTRTGAVRSWAEVFLAVSLSLLRAKWACKLSNISLCSLSALARSVSAVVALISAAVALASAAVALVSASVALAIAAVALVSAAVALASASASVALASVKASAAVALVSAAVALASAAVALVSAAVALASAAVALASASALGTAVVASGKSRAVSSLYLILKFLQTPHIVWPGALGDTEAGYEWCVCHIESRKIGQSLQGNGFAIDRATSLRRI